MALLFTNSIFQVEVDSIMPYKEYVKKMYWVLFAQYHCFSPLLSQIKFIYKHFTTQQTLVTVLIHIDVNLLTTFVFVYE